MEVKESLSQVTGSTNDHVVIKFQVAMLLYYSGRSMVQLYCSWCSNLFMDVSTTTIL